MAFKYKVVLTLSPLLFFLDQLTKYLVRENIPYGKGIPVINGVFDIIHATNTGAAFGMFAGSDGSFRIPFFYIVAFVALVMIAVYLVKLETGDRLMAVILALIISGIFGNITDRLMAGAVTDFLSLHIGNAVFDKVIFGYHFHVPLEWPAFNVADSAITVAMVLLVIHVIKTGRRTEGK